MSIIIRKATVFDVPAIHALIHELAEYENAAHEHVNTIEDMIRDGFGPEPVYKALVAEDTESQEVVGSAVYYFNYSTWKGKCLYLDDLIVTESYRGKKIGKLLFDGLVREAKEHKAKRVLWQVLDWNEPAIRFYKRINTFFDPGWVNCKLLESELEIYKFEE